MRNGWFKIFWMVVNIIFFMTLIGFIAVNNKKETNSNKTVTQGIKKCILDNSETGILNTTTYIISYTNDEIDNYTKQINLTLLDNNFEEQFEIYKINYEMDLNKYNDEQSIEIINKIDDQNNYGYSLKRLLNVPFNNSNLTDTFYYKEDMKTVENVLSLSGYTCE